MSMTATVHQLPRPRHILADAAARHYATGGRITAYRVTHLSFDLEEGWSIELTRNDQTTTAPIQPMPVDLPDDVRAALIQFLGASDKIPA